MKSFYKTLLGETGRSDNPYFLNGCLSIQFFDSTPFLQHLCDLWDAMSHYWSPNASHTQPPT